MGEAHFQGVNYMASEFLKAYGASIISAVVGLALVLMGLLFNQMMVLMAGLAALGVGTGLHVGGHTNVVPTKTEDAVEHILQKGGKVKMPGVSKLNDVLGKP